MYSMNSLAHHLSNYLINLRNTVASQTFDIKSKLIDSNRFGSSFLVDFNTISRDIM